MRADSVIASIRMMSDYARARAVGMNARAMSFAPQPLSRADLMTCDAHALTNGIGQIAMTESDAGADATTIAAGAAYIMLINDEWAAVAIGTLRRTEIDAARDVEENGYGAQVGLRGMPIPKLETRAFLSYADVIDDETSLFVSGDYWLSPALAAVSLPNSAVTPTP